LTRALKKNEKQNGKRERREKQLRRNGNEKSNKIEKERMISRIYRSE